MGRARLRDCEDAGKGEDEARRREMLLDRFPLAASAAVERPEAEGPIPETATAVAKDRAPAAASGARRRGAVRTPRPRRKLASASAATVHVRELPSGACRPRALDRPDEDERGDDHDRRAPRLGAAASAHAPSAAEPRRLRRAQRSCSGSRTTTRLPRRAPRAKAPAPQRGAPGALGDAPEREGDEHAPSSANAPPSEP